MFSEALKAPSQGRRTIFKECLSILPHRPEHLGLCRGRTRNETATRLELKVRRKREQIFSVQVHVNAVSIYLGGGRKAKRGKCAFIPS